VPYWSVRAVGDERPTQVRLLEVPAGWELSPDVVFPLTRFQAGYRYRLGTGEIADQPVEFTLDDLGALGPGQVWAHPSPGRHEAALDRDEFFRAAEQYCN
jgi:hypothetical protein